MKVRSTTSSQSCKQMKTNRNRGTAPQSSMEGQTPSARPKKNVQFTSPSIGDFSVSLASYYRAGYETRRRKLPYLHLQTHPQGGATTIPSIGNGGQETQDGKTIPPEIRNRTTAEGPLQLKRWPTAFSPVVFHPSYSRGTDPAYVVQPTLDARGLDDRRRR